MQPQNPLPSAAPSPAPPSSGGGGTWAWATALANFLVSAAIGVLQWLAPSPSPANAVLLALLAVWIVTFIVSIVVLWRATRSVPLVAGLGWKLWLPYAVTIIGAFVIGASLGIRGTSSAVSSFGDLPFSAQLDSAAWQAYKEGRDDDALKVTEMYLQIFKQEAEQLQAGMSTTSPPPLGRVDDLQQRNTIYARGPLNGVAACYFIRGMIFQKRGDVASARDAFLAAEALPFARVIDPASQEFWSPAQKSAEQRVLLNRPITTSTP